MIEIGELHLKIPGLNEEQSNLLGRKVAENVAESLPNLVGNHQIDTLNLKIESLKSTDTNYMASQISQEIIRQIKLATY
jgi:hypothetical protein